MKQRIRSNFNDEVICLSLRLFCSKIFHLNIFVFDLVCNLCCRFNKSTKNLVLQTSLKDNLPFLSQVKQIKQSFEIYLSTVVVHSIGKQMVSDAHPAPWFAHTISRKVDADGPVSVGDNVRSLLLPIVDKSSERSGERSGNTRSIMLDVKLLARVSLLDDRGCMGPAGNATAYGEPYFELGIA